MGLRGGEEVAESWKGNAWAGKSGLQDAFQAVNDAGMHMHNWGNQKLKCGAFLFKAVVCCSWGQVYILKTKKKPIAA